MNGLHRILRRTHCRNTHHLLALDALPLVQTEPGKRLAGWLLRYHDAYLTGATDPDTRLRDYHNQIAHVEEGFWGGAPRVAHQWYNRLLRRLDNDKYADAAQAAGILSHYFTDVLQPLHTGSTPRESLVHRPFEWSVFHAYDDIRQRWLDDELRIVFQLSGEPGWLGSAMLHGARYANTKFSLLVNSYRFNEGIKDPPEGLDGPSREALAELIGLAITGWARVIERVALDAETIRRRPLANATVTWPTALAIARAPCRRWRARVEHCLERQKINALAKEFRRKGRLRKHLPHEVDIKQRVIQVHHDEARYQVEREYWAKKRRQQRAHTAKETAIVAQPSKPVSIATSVTQSTKPQLSPSDPLIQAPSFGPKTAERFAAMGIKTVEQLLSCDPGTLASELNAYWITAESIQLWKTQATLMCEIPALNKLDAQMLAGAGFQSAGQVVHSDPRLIHAEVQRFALTSAGRRYLASNKIPTADDVSQWIKNAA